MTTHKKLQWIVGLAAGMGMLAMAAGCQNQDKPLTVRGEDFPTDEFPRQAHQFADQQAANGARADATLRPMHFDGGRLNSLGEERLDLMIRNGDDCSPLILYLDLPQEDENIDHCRQSAVAYLRQRGLAEDQIKVESGPNPKYTTRVAPLLAAQQNPSQPQQTSAPTGGAGTSMGGSH